MYGIGKVPALIELALHSSGRQIGNNYTNRCIIKCQEGARAMKEKRKGKSEWVIRWGYQMIV